MGSDTDHLKTRWRTELGRQCLQRVLAAARQRREWGRMLGALRGAGEVVSGRDLRGADLRGQDLRSADLQQADLSGADLCEADLYGADLTSAVLAEANLTEANLRSASLFEADLRGARLERADLSWTDMSRADLSDANLMNADLRGANLSHARLSGTLLTGARLFGAKRDQWQLKGVHCAYVYWDGSGQERSPEQRRLRDGEFERLYAAAPLVQYVFRHGTTPLDALLLDYVALQLQRERPEVGLQLKAFTREGTEQRATFAVNAGAEPNGLERVIDALYRRTVQELQSDPEHLFQVLSSLYATAGTEAAAGEGEAAEEPPAEGPAARLADDLDLEAVREAIGTIMEVVEAEPRSTFQASGKRIVVRILRKMEQDLENRDRRAASLKMNALAVSLHPIRERIETEFRLLRSIL